LLKNDEKDHETVLRITDVADRQPSLNTVSLAIETSMDSAMA
jgi:hypothetical protein